MVWCEVCPCLERDDGASGACGGGVQEGRPQSDGRHNTEDYQVGHGDAAGFSNAGDGGDGYSDGAGYSGNGGSGVGGGSDYGT